MFDKDSFEKQLNSDHQFRQKFLSDPVKTLSEAGLELDDAKADKLRTQLANLKGQNLPAGASIAANGVAISISKSF